MKYLSIIKYVLLILSVVLTVVGVTELSLDAMLLWAFGLLCLTIALAVIMPVFGLIQNPQSAGRSLMGLGLVVIVFVVSYMLADAEPIRLAGGTKVFDDAGQLLFADTGLYATYITFMAVIATIIVTEVYKIFK